MDTTHRFGEAIPTPDFSELVWGHEHHPGIDAPAGDLWLFAYGSLIWKPGFEPAEQCPARLHGFHRALCLWSVEHRGTVAQPGLVMGLDAGGSCNGVALRVPEPEREIVLEALNAREMITGAYQSVVKTLHLTNGRRVQAVALVVRREHPQYANGLSPAQTAWIVRRANGRSGSNAEYVENTLDRLKKWGIHDPRLSQLVAEW